MSATKPRMAANLLVRAAIVAGATVAGSAVAWVSEIPAEAALLPGPPADLSILDSPISDSPSASGDAGGTASDAAGTSADPGRFSLDDLAPGDPVADGGRAPVPDGQAPARPASARTAPERDESVVRIPAPALPRLDDSGSDDPVDSARETASSEKPAEQAGPLSETLDRTGPVSRTIGWPTGEVLPDQLFARLPKSVDSGLSGLERPLRRVVDSAPVHLPALAPSPAPVEHGPSEHGPSEHGPVAHGASEGGWIEHRVVDTEAKDIAAPPPETLPRGAEHVVTRMAAQPADPASSEPETPAEQRFPGPHPSLAPGPPVPGSTGCAAADGKGPGYGLNVGRYIPSSGPDGRCSRVLPLSHARSLTDGAHPQPGTTPD